MNFARLKSQIGTLKTSPKIFSPLPYSTQQTDRRRRAFSLPAVDKRSTTSYDDDDDNITTTRTQAKVIFYC
jgi:hypothetical protein